MSARLFTVLWAVAGAEAQASDRCAEALAELQSPDGPSRFGVVRDGIFRGGQPTARHLQLLRELGVETVIDLRREDRSAVEAEAQEARRLGMRFLHFPFYGVFGADAEFLWRVVDAIRTGGRVYIHCRIGRDRTSLVVALYRVLVDGWDANLAWYQEAVRYGHRRGLWYGAIVRSFERAVSKLQ